MKILDLTSDPYLAPAAGPGVEVTCLPVGKPVNPWPECKAIPRGRPWQVAWHFLKARLGGYDWVILPPVHVGWAVTNGRLQRSVKKAIRGLSAQPWLCGLSRGLIFGSSCRYAICDASDLDSASHEFARISGAAVYFKRNLILTEPQPGGPEWHPLPMPVPDAWLDEAAKDSPAKDSDYFSAGEYNSAERNELLEVGRELAAKGWKTDLLEERVAPGEFWKRIARSRLCAAAQGWGYHSWRMFEAGGLGSVPIVNRPPAGMWSWFVDGENCLFMKNEKAATLARIEALLRDPERIHLMATRARAEVDAWHRQSAIASRMTDVLKRLGDS